MHIISEIIILNDTYNEENNEHNIEHFHYCNVYVLKVIIKLR
jgi:hypothetical protein